MKTYTVGRNATCDISVSDDSVSGAHLEVTLADDGSFYIVDQCSTNGTFIYNGSNWEPIRQGKVMPDQFLSLGSYSEKAGQLFSKIIHENATTEPAKAPLKAKKPRREPATGKVVFD